MRATPRARLFWLADDASVGAPGLGFSSPGVRIENDIMAVGGAMDYVVRGGTATADLLQNGYVRHKGMPNVFGFSVQYSPGRSLKDLSAAGGFLNHQISYATPDELSRSVRPLGYDLQLINTPGKGYHHTECVLYDTSKAMLQTLPRDAAVAISAAFRRMPNPALQP